MYHGIREQFDKAWRETEVIRASTPHLFTFGDSTLRYTVLTPSEMHDSETVLREGHVVVRKPVIVTPYNQDAVQLEGFGELDAGAGFLIERMAYFPRLNYRNESNRLEVLNTEIDKLADRILRRLDEDDDHLMAVIKGPAGAWQISILRYSVEKMIQSTPANIQELKERGFLKDPPGL